MNTNFYCPLCGIVLNSSYSKCHKCSWDAKEAKKHNDAVVKKFAMLGKIEYHVHKSTGRKFPIITKEMRKEMLPYLPQENYISTKTR